MVLNDANTVISDLWAKFQAGNTAVKPTYDALVALVQSSGAAAIGPGGVLSAGFAAQFQNIVTAGPQSGALIIVPNVVPTNIPGSPIPIQNTNQAPTLVPPVSIGGGLNQKTLFVVALAIGLYLLLR